MVRRHEKKARSERAEQSFAQGEYNFASEALAELEGEGHLDAEIGLLRGQVHNAVRQSWVRELLEGARRFFAATEYALAEIKIDEALDLDPKNAETLQLRGELEKGRSDSKAAESIAQVRHHLEGRALPQARETLEKLLGQRPNDRRHYSYCPM